MSKTTVTHMNRRKGINATKFFPGSQREFTKLLSKEFTAAEIEDGGTSERERIEDALPKPEKSAETSEKRK